MIKLSFDNLPFERLVVSESLALELFEDNQYKRAQVPSIAETGNGSVTLYRIGNFIDMSKGPCMANTNLMGKCSIAAIHPFKVEQTQLYRVQGIALPRGFRVFSNKFNPQQFTISIYLLQMNHYTYGILEERAKKPVLYT